MLTIEGNIVNLDKTSRGRIEIDQQSGLITKVGQATGVADVVLAEELIFPGFVDLHVHARECAGHSEDYKEDFTTAGAAAINGGVTAFAEMPNNPVPPVDDASYEAKNQLAKKSAVEVLLYAGIGPNTKPLSKNVPYKVYMAKSIGDLFFNSHRDLESVIKNYSGQYISFHCEDPAVLQQNKNQPTHGQRRPPEAEIMAIDFALELIEKYQLKGKICHCSTMEGLKKISAAKKRGVKVTVEASPHHLYFDDTVIASAAEAISSKKKIASSDALLAMARSLQINPPIRQTKDNRLALIAALKKGEIDYLATDHSPHTIMEKENGISGLPQLDTYGPFVSWLMQEHSFSPQDVARVCSYNPGNFINNFISVKYGKIAEGFAGSLSVIDMNKPIKIQKQMLKTKAGWSPFEAVEFPGSVVYTVVKGKIYNLGIR